MAFWSGEKLSEAARQIFEPFNEKAIDCNAYTLHMGSEYYRTGGSHSESEVRTKVKLNEGESFVIPAGQFAFLLTSEIIRIPSHIMAFISIKAKVKFQGLINISGFHVDPGYNGRLVFTVYNASPSPIHLEQDMPLFLVWLADLDRDSSSIKGKDDGYYNITNDLLKGMNKNILSLQAVSEKISQQEHNILERISRVESRVDEKIQEVEIKLGEQKPSIDNLHFIWRTIIVGIFVAFLLSVAGVLAPIYYGTGSFVWELLEEKISSNEEVEG